MELLRCRTRLSVLWVFMAVGMSAYMFIYFMMPGVIEEMMAGRMEGMELSDTLMTIYALYWLIPLVMAVLCLTLNGSANRWMNFVLGIIWFLWLIVEVIEHATMGGTVYIATYLGLAAGIVIAAYIVYFAWKLPKGEA